MKEFKQRIRHIIDHKFLLAISIFSFLCILFSFIAAGDKNFLWPLFTIIFLTAVYYLAITNYSSQAGCVFCIVNLAILIGLFAWTLMPWDPNNSVTFVFLASLGCFGIFIALLAYNYRFPDFDSQPHLHG